MHKLQTRRYMATQENIEPDYLLDPISRSATSLKKPDSMGSLGSSLGLGPRSATVSHSQPSLGRRASSALLNSVMNSLGLRKESSTILVENGPANTPFGYLRCDATITMEKVKYKLDDVKHHLDIEQKVKTGTEKMLLALASLPPSDAKQKDLVCKLEESKAKVSLLTKALSSYEAIHVHDPEDSSSNLDRVQSDSVTSIGTLSRPKPKQLSGRLKIRLGSSLGLPGLKSSKTDTFIVIRVDQAERARTRASKGRWNEDVDIVIDKAQEIEFDVYEKPGNVLAMIWMRLEDLVDELNLKKQEAETDPSRVSGSLSIAHSGIEAWIGLEPSGQLQVKLNFLAETVPKKSKSGVSRQRPVQKVFLQKGHKFTAIRSYQVLKCATCSEFLVSGQGYQCQHCNYMCHKKCQTRVASKCISKSHDEEDETESIIKHKIPHRFEPSTSLSVHWCCHCGVMLPLGKRGYSRCSECSRTCHKECAPLVPDFCGLSNELIAQYRTIELMGRQKREKPLEKAVSAGSLPLLTLVPPPVLPPLSTSFSHRDFSSTYSMLESSKLSLNDLMTGSNGAMSKSSSASNLDATTMVEKPKKTRKSRGDSMMPFSALKGVGLDDFNFLAVLGKGNFGKVMLAEEKHTKQLYAIKVLKKEFIIENDEVESTKAEKRVFQVANQARHPFLVNLHSCFQTESRIYFVMEFVAGGDLMFHIQQRQFSEKRAKFYACEVLLALEYFHKNNIVYRDLKLDNILLSVDGHIKIADYGLCKENMSFGSVTTTFCGTPEFMAPEILAEKPYGRAVDWWAFGVFIYECLLGQSPFKGDDEEEIFEAILKQQVVYPAYLQPQAVDLLKSLLNKDPLTRLGCGPTDSAEIRAHPYFHGIDWVALYNLEIPPPFKPTISAPTDVSNFDEEFTREVPVLTPCTSILSTANQEEFRGFTHISDWAQADRSRFAAKMGQLLA